MVHTAHTSKIGPRTVMYSYKGYKEKKWVIQDYYSGTSYGNDQKETCWIKRKKRWILVPGPLFSQSYELH